MQPPEGIPPALRYGIYAVQQVGFPIGVAAYLLFRADGLLRGLTDAFQGQQAAFLANQAILEALLRAVQP